MNTPLHFDIGSSTLGRVLVALTNNGIAAILLGDSDAAVTRELLDRFPDATLTRDAAASTRALKQVIDLVDGRRAALDLPLDPAGTEFQHKVWRALAKIPAGRTASYAEIARRIDAPTSFRAVAQACGANPLALAIPCHRVVRGDGGLSGYRWGVARKRALLERESMQAPRRGVARSTSDMAAR
ncbi:MAG TPA: methylated-DNA--[protein]-cysteine S-methyltransferase [Steroidobacteraceae bacterium]|nr:methylated-DNA--[protein]-cysteine S-methyltransferase [Steroidobacteraceae bacterium]